jgi:hypothetical protein
VGRLFLAGAAPACLGLTDGRASISAAGRLPDSRGRAGASSAGRRRRRSGPPGPRDHPRRILAGFVTPTEAAARRPYSLIVGIFIHREPGGATCRRSRQSAVCDRRAIIVAAKGIGLRWNSRSDQVVGGIPAVTRSRAILLLVNVLFLVLGCLPDAAMIIFVPVLLPVKRSGSTWSTSAGRGAEFDDRLPRLFRSVPVVHLVGAGRRRRRRGGRPVHRALVVAFLCTYWAPMVLW